MSDSSTPTWEQRFRAPVLGVPTWSPATPDRLILCSTESGTYQVHAWDAVSGERRQLSAEPVGVSEVIATADGAGVVWFSDLTGDESGGFVVAP